MKPLYFPNHLKGAVRDLCWTIMFYYTYNIYCNSYYSTSANTLLSKGNTIDNLANVMVREIEKYHKMEYIKFHE